LRFPSCVSPPHPRSTLFPYTTLFRSLELQRRADAVGGLTLMLEPGRSIVGNAGILVTEVIYHKAGDDKDFLLVDAGMNDLMRPRSEEHTSELQSRENLVCRLLLEKKN